ncbi:MAG: hypothetical protein D6820_03070 [Lentisphaerae bacterium]|nr:MAG: hypothetical protein D6820_03070 [Lentisphaerota bacterium]
MEDIPEPPNPEDLLEPENPGIAKEGIAQTQQLDVDENATTRLERDPSQLVLTGMPATNSSAPPSIDDFKSDTEALREQIDLTASIVGNGFRPFFSPHGTFIPFSDEDFNTALANEDGDLFPYLEQVQPGGHCWSYQVFGIILEYHVNKYLPEWDWPTEFANVFLGSTSKYLHEMNQDFLTLLNILRRMVRPLGEPFQHNIEYHDIFGWMEMVVELDERMNELFQFFQQFTAKAFPHKDPFYELFAEMVAVYSDVRWRLLDICERLYARSTLTPFAAQKGTISVSLIFPRIYRLNILLGNLIPV